MKERIFFDDVDRYGPQTASLVLPLPTEEVNRDEMARMDEVAITATVAPGDLQQEYLATGEVSYTADLRCGRCLDPYPFASRTAFSLLGAIRFASRDRIGAGSAFNRDETTLR